MRDGLPSTVAVDQVRKEGFYMLYRGVLSPLGMRAVSLSLMFGSYGSCRAFLQTNVPQLNKHAALLFSAALAGISEACVVLPFERVQTLLLDKKFNLRFQNSVHAFRHLWKHHPTSEFYRGASTIMFRNSFANALYFSVRENADKVMPKQSTTFGKFIVDFINGGLIGAINSTLYYPVNVVKTRMQSRLGGEFQSPKDVLVKIYNERGRKLQEMYRGVHMNYTRSMLSWGITNASFELIHKYLDTVPTNER
ncbi:Solute carrier family 25 member 51 [Orchesella cincta]|uniref:Solute carrier family 25 member 51 n=1 Tax=Orchesella cincta TaxID=48709 RepID=A0A1D2M300_ORCCI|nr:Solute carrier family 25 member 51 [Orchesella cincta]